MRAPQLPAGSASWSPFTSSRGRIPRWNESFPRVRRMETDRDLASIAEARALARRARQAWLELAEFSQERIDAIVDEMAAAATTQAEAFARLAVDQPDLDGDLQNPHFAQSALRGCAQPASRSGEMHHAGRGGHGRGGAARRGSRRLDQLDDDG